ncbi:MAG: RusA family crossover junction endodeoxyribonuclease [Planctomycetota bacterium]|jgi:crossover junction endodeoxyribonuclease RusA|nr:RusA family crossover junction endodeoxyribonuclease [Planctomycetota bacterium]
MIELELPWPPSVNHYWRHVSIGGRVITKISRAGREYREAVKQIVWRSGIVRQTGAIQINRLLYCPDWRERDEDNTTKAIYDGLCHAGAIDGDQFVCSGVVEKRKSADGRGRVIVQISCLDKGVIVKPSGAWLM